MPFIDTKKLNPKEPAPGWEGRFFHSENMTFAYYDVAAGASIHEHWHENEEVWNVIEGELEFTIANETRILAPGSAAVIPANTPHSVKVLKNARAIIVDYPLRHSVGGIDLD